jgi:hypothetical protein
MLEGFFRYGVYALLAFLAWQLIKIGWKGIPPYDDDDD